MICFFSWSSKTLVGWETLRFGSDLTKWDRKTGISQSRMTVALNVKVLLRKLKRIQYVATDVSHGGMDLVGALM